MNHSGDAAEQIVRISLDGVQVAAKITGAAAKELAIFLMAAMKNSEKNLKLKGKTRLTSMLKSGNALEIFSVKESDLKSFTQGAKQYGIVYCVLRNAKNSSDGLCDIMVKADDAPKINRLVERLKLATVAKATVESEIVAEKADTEPKTSNAGNTEKLVDDLLGTPEVKAEKENSRPLADGGEMPPKTNQSEPISASKNKSARGITNKPSVKLELGEITEDLANRAKKVLAGIDNSKSKKTKERS